MAEDEAMKEFKEGLKLLNNQYSSKALPHLARALELDNRNPFYLSYMGLALAAAQQKWAEAEEHCYNALRMKRNQPELYLNLAKVYRLAGRKADAVETLMAGLPLTRQDARLTKELRKLGFRRPPILPFLDRNHFLNRELGKLRNKFLKSAGKEA